MWRRLAAAVVLALGALVGCIGTLEVAASLTSVALSTPALIVGLLACCVLVGLEIGRLLVGEE